MTALFYLLAAVGSATMSTRAWLGRRDSSAHTAFLFFGWCLAIIYFAFSLSLLPHLQHLRVIYMAGGMAIPLLMLWVIDLAFVSKSGNVSQHLRWIFGGTLLAIPALVLTHALFYQNLDTRSPPQLLAAFLTFAAFAVPLRRLYEAHEATTLRVDKARLRYLLAFASAAVFFTLIEHIGRNLMNPIEPTALSMLTRGAALQGPVPPISVLFAVGTLYCLYHTLVNSRLLDLHELFSRMILAVSMAGALVLIVGVTVLWFRSADYDYGVHSTFQLFLASLFFLAIYDPLRQYMARWSNTLFNRRGQQLTETLQSLQRHLPIGVSAKAVAENLLEGLHSSGRAPVISVYLWNQSHDTYLCSVHRNTDESRPLDIISAHPFIDGFVAEQPWYLREALERSRNPEHRQVVGLMEAMRAELTIPLRFKSAVVGWINLADEDWSDGYSAEEIRQLSRLGGTVSLVLGNIQDFKTIERRNRLAALGSMATGLAHEIRNPLAGIKGAAQFLQGEDIESDASEMLQVVVDEANRLNTVVSQFLDYARPFELHPESSDLNQLVKATISLLHAQGINEGVNIKERLSDSLPATMLDKTNISQVLLNLAQNALHEMAEGGDLTFITRAGELPDGGKAVEVAVQDTGGGIVGSEVEKVFAPFYTTKKGGTGLGLAICQRIVAAHDGEFDLSSPPEGGALFVVKLPLRQNDL